MITRNVLRCGQQHAAPVLGLRVVVDENCRWSSLVHADDHLGDLLAELSAQLVFGNRGVF